MDIDDIAITILRLYQSENKKYGEVLALEKLSDKLKSQYHLSNIEVLQLLKEFKQSKYCTIFGGSTCVKINFITLPKWGTKVKFYKLSELSFSHLIVFDVKD